MGVRIDLNVDVGEAFGVWSMGEDATLFAHVTSVNVACGFHAGDPTVIDRTVAYAVRAGVAVGAHPSHWDLRGFGRREMKKALVRSLQLLMD
ncbi:MAG TPA: LamB/YcsF family protein [Vicinamibacteria bacterium]|nr:LamB/YcsF family protein [Vicinamibacteria bacterium]